MMAEYISVDQLFKCETCFHNQNGKCYSWCDASESYRPAYDKLKKVDAVEVVRCKDCKHGRSIDPNRSPEKYFKSDCIVCECEDVVGDESMIYKHDHFCSYGERKENLHG